MPPYLHSIGLITSAHGAAISDFSTNLGQYGFKVKVCDVLVEGLKAVSQVTNALKFLNEYYSDLDAIVITRGGGSLESLQAFNSEMIARAIAGSRIPVISAIGHERDWTIADLVADYRVSTPTAAGKYLSECWAAAPSLINSVEKTMLSSMTKQLSHLQHLIDTQGNQLLSVFTAWIGKIEQSVHHHTQMLTSYVSNIILRYRQDESMFRTNLTYFKHQAKAEVNRLTQVENSVTARAHHWFVNLVSQLDHQEKLLVQSDPELRLKQGYAIARTQAGTILRSAGQVMKGSTITIKLHHGVIDSLVEKITS